MLEKELLNEFEEFSKRRLANKYNVENSKIYEEFIFSSCGDEFFRDEKLLKDEIKNSNINRYEKLAEMSESEVLMVSEEDRDYNPIITYKTEYYESPLKLHRDRASEKENINIINFGVCRINKIPFTSTKIELKESFSTHTDFHVMHHNEQMMNYKLKYIWVLFKWVRISKINETF